MFFKRKVNREVRLDKNKDYVFCFNNGTIILEEQCNMYEHNKECDAKHDVWGRTHIKGSNSGAQMQGDNYPLLNECKYCIEDHEIDAYCLSAEAMECYIQMQKELGVK